MDLVDRILEGDESSVARLISMLEEGKEEGYMAVSLLFPHTGRAHIMGVTGSPGAGKSTIVDKLAFAYGTKGKKVGIIAVDPTSAKGGGAFLGDRIRMRNAEKIEGIFIRSMAHRGFPGGIAKATAGACYVLDSSGKDVIIIESVGAGQADMQISTICDSVITVFTPDYGDDIQLMKAGLIEIGDIVVVNKMDKPGATEVAKDIEFFLVNRTNQPWHTPVVSIDALKGEGIENLVQALKQHRTFMDRDTHARTIKRDKRKNLVLNLLKEETWNAILNRIEEQVDFSEIMEKVQDGTMDPYKAVQLLMRIAVRGAESTVSAKENKRETNR